jgi:hypothetical protein
MLWRRKDRNEVSANTDANIPDVPDANASDVPDANGANTEIKQKNVIKQDVMAEVKKEEKVIRLTDKVAVEATETNPSVKAGRMTSGQKYEVHPSHVDYLVKNGYAKLIG